MTTATAADVLAGDFLHRVAPLTGSWVFEAPLDARVLDVARETHRGIMYAVLTLEPQAPATRSLVRVPLDRNVVLG